jgi:hypothetical protein
MTDYKKWDKLINDMSSDEDELEEVPAIGPGGRKRTFRLPKKQVRDMREKNQTDEERGLRSEMKRIEKEMKKNSARMSEPPKHPEDDSKAETTEPEGSPWKLVEGLVETGEVDVEKFLQEKGSGYKHPKLLDEVSVSIAGPLKAGEPPPPDEEWPKCSLLLVKKRCPGPWLAAICSMLKGEYARFRLPEISLKESDIQDTFKCFPQLLMQQNGICTNDATNGAGVEFEVHLHGWAEAAKVKHMKKQTDSSAERGRAKQACTKWMMRKGKGHSTPRAFYEVSLRCMAIRKQLTKRTKLGLQTEVQDNAAMLPPSLCDVVHAMDSISHGKAGGEWQALAESSCAATKVVCSSARAARTSRPSSAGGSKANGTRVANKKPTGGTDGQPKGGTGQGRRLRLGKVLLEGDCATYVCGCKGGAGHKQLPSLRALMGGVVDDMVLCMKEGEISMAMVQQEEEKDFPPVFMLVQLVGWCTVLDLSEVSCSGTTSGLDPVGEYEQRVHDKGIVLKKVCHQGKGWEVPVDGSVCQIQYMVNHASTGALLGGSSWDVREPFEVRVGSGRCIRAIDLALRTMKKGEMSRLEVGARRNGEEHEKVDGEEHEEVDGDAFDYGYADFEVSMQSADAFAGGGDGPGGYDLQKLPEEMKGALRAAGVPLELAVAATNGNATDGTATDGTATDEGDIAAAAAALRSVGPPIVMQPPAFCPLTIEIELIDFQSPRKQSAVFDEKGSDNNSTMTTAERLAAGLRAKQSGGRLFSKATAAAKKAVAKKAAAQTKEAAVAGTDATTAAEANDSGSAKGRHGYDAYEGAALNYAEAVAFFRPRLTATQKEAVKARKAGQKQEEKLQNKADAGDDDDESAVELREEGRFLVERILSADRAEVITSLLQPCHLNLSMCALKRGEHKRALRHAEWTLTLSRIKSECSQVPSEGERPKPPTSGGQSSGGQSNGGQSMSFEAKAHYRKALALVGLAEVKQAKASMLEAARLAPQSREVRRQVDALGKKLKEQKSRDQKSFGRLFERAESETDAMDGYQKRPAEVRGDMAHHPLVQWLARDKRNDLNDQEKGREKLKGEGGYGGWKSNPSFPQSQKGLTGADDGECGDTAEVVQAAEVAEQAVPTPAAPAAAAPALPTAAPALPIPATFVTKSAQEIALEAQEIASEIAAIKTQISDDNYERAGELRNLQLKQAATESAAAKVAATENAAAEKAAAAKATAEKVAAEKEAAEKAAVEAAAAEKAAAETAAAVKAARVSIAPPRRRDYRMEQISEQQHGSSTVTAAADPVGAPKKGELADMMSGFSANPSEKDLSDIMALSPEEFDAKVKELTKTYGEIERAQKAQERQKEEKKKGKGKATLAQKLTRAHRKRESGQRKHAEGKPKVAVELFEEALASLAPSEEDRQAYDIYQTEMAKYNTSAASSSADLMHGDPAYSGLTDVEVVQLQQEQLPCHLGLAECQLHLANCNARGDQASKKCFEEALHHSSKALAVVMQRSGGRGAGLQGSAMEMKAERERKDATKVDALYRRGQAHAGLDRYEEAEADVEEALKLLIARSSQLQVAEVGDQEEEIEAALQTIRACRQEQRERAQQERTDTQRERGGLFGSASPLAGALSK